MKKLSRPEKLTTLLIVLFIISIGFQLSGYVREYLDSRSEYVEVDEWFIVNSTTIYRDFPFDTEVHCQAGVRIDHFKSLDKTSISGCPGLVKDSRGWLTCSGYGKMCFAKYKKLKGAE